MSFRPSKMRPASLSRLVVGSLISVSYATFWGQNEPRSGNLMIQYAKMPIFLKKPSFGGSILSKRCSDAFRKCNPCPCQALLGVSF